MNMIPIPNRLNGMQLRKTAGKSLMMTKLSSLALKIYQRRHLEMKFQTLTLRSKGLASQLICWYMSARRRLTFVR